MGADEMFDLVVIGGGAAGEKGAVQAAYFGKRVALIEKEAHLGGAMVNTGTIPSKTLRETALYLSGFRQRGLHGVDVQVGRKATVGDFLHRLSSVMSQEQARMSANLKKHGVTVMQGTASFVDANTVNLAGSSGATTVRGHHFLIATGSAPHRPVLFPFDETRIYDSDEIVRLDTLPESMSIVGAGVIGCEYACLFAAMGVHVTLIENRAMPLSFLDLEIAARLKAKMLALGIQVRMPAQVTACEVTTQLTRLTLDTGEKIEADCVLVCAGRQANTATLKLEAAGLESGKRGQLDVDNRFRTRAPHIAAVGDVIGFPSLASTSMEQARVAVVHLFDLKYKMTMAAQFPYGIYTIPEVSMVGETEESLTEKKIDYVVGRAELSQNARGLIIGEDGLLKLLFRKSDLRLLGVHCIGEQATELIHVGLAALMTQSTADLFIHMCFNYPTLSDAYKYAAYDALGRKGNS